MKNRNFNMIVNCLFFSVCAVCVFSILSISEASTYYVDQNNPQANDTNQGNNETLPWLTLTKAVKTVVAGDTVIVKAGRYIDSTSTWERAFNPTNSGIASNPIIFRSQPRGAAVVVRKDKTVPSFGIQGKSYIVIDGFKSEGLLQAHTCDHITFQNNEVIYGSIQGNDNSLNFGMNIHATYYSLIRNNYVHDMDDSGNHLHNTAAIMVFVNSDNNIIESNLVDCGPVTDGTANIYNAYGTKGGGMDDNIWRYNIGKNCTSGFMGMGDTAETNHTYRGKIYQNIIMNSKNFAEMHHGVEDWDIYNNVSYNNETFINGGYYLDSSSVANKRIGSWNNIIVNAGKGYYRDPSTASFSQFLDYSNHNDFINCDAIAAYNSGSKTYGNIGVWNSATGFDANSISNDALFVDPSSENFHLQPSSPAIGIDIQDYDNDGDTNEVIDMGVYISRNVILLEDNFDTGYSIINNHSNMSGLSAEFKAKGWSGIWWDNSSYLEISNTKSHSGAQSVLHHFENNQDTATLYGKISNNETELYASYWIYLASDYWMNWSTNGGEQKFGRYFCGDGGPGTVLISQHLYPEGRIVSGTGINMEWELNNNSSVYVAKDYDFSTNKGKWIHLEYYYKLNTPGMSDGIMMFWVDGTKQTIYGWPDWKAVKDNEFIFMNTGTYYFKSFWVISLNNGTPSPAQNLWLDDFLLRNDLPDIKTPDLNMDINSDGKVDITDIQACVNHILGVQDYGTKVDVNSDGSVNVQDVQMIVNTILGN